MRAGSVSCLLVFAAMSWQMVISYIALKDVRRAALCRGKALLGSWPVRGPHLPCSGWPSPLWSGKSRCGSDDVGHNS